MALSVTLLLGAGLMQRSLVRLRAVDPSFASAGVSHFRVSLPDARYPDAAQAVRFVQSVQEQLAAIPGVESAGYILGLPMSGLNISGGFTRLDQPPPEPGLGPTAAYRAIDPHYLGTLSVPLLSGRNFLPTDRAGSLPVVIINERLAQRYFAGEDPIGKQIDVQVSTGYPDTLPRTIIGVIGSVRAISLTQEPEPALYVPDAQTGGGFGHFVMRSAHTTQEVLSAARAIVASVDPQIPLIRPGAMDDLLADDGAQHTFYLVLLGLFAVLAVTLATVGMYGVVAFGVTQRTGKIGVRMATGARSRQVVSLVVGQALRPALLGASAGAAGALAAGRVISGLLYQVEPQDPVTCSGLGPAPWRLRTRVRAAGIPRRAHFAVDGLARRQMMRLAARRIKIAPWSSALITDEHGGGEGTILMGERSPRMSVSGWPHAYPLGIFGSMAFFDNVRARFREFGRAGGRRRAERMGPTARSMSALRADTLREIRSRFGDTSFERLGLPGGDIVDIGLEQLMAGRATLESLAVSIAAPRLRREGVPIGPTLAEPEFRLFEQLEHTGGDLAHARYNALMRRLVSFADACRLARIDRTFS